MSAIATRPPPYAVPPVQPEIIGTDDRRRVTDTTASPFRFVCCIDRFFGTSTQPVRTSGVLISPSHVLTVGHTVLSRSRGAVARMNVAVARDGRTTPFGVVAARSWRAHDNWVHGFNTQFDLALITLASPIGNAVFNGKRLGWWGDRATDDNRLTVVDPAKLRGTAVNLSGYPGDKCNGVQMRAQHRCTNAVQHAGSPATCTPATDRGSTQWCSFATIQSPIAAGEPGLMHYHLDSKGGHSGSPVWLRWKTTRWLLAIHRGVDCGSGLNEGVRLTDALWTTIRSWM